MINYRDTLVKMGINPEEDLNAKTLKRIKRADALCKNGGGGLVSRQAIAVIIEDEQPGLIDKMMGEE